MKDAQAFVDEVAGRAKRTGPRPKDLRDEGLKAVSELDPASLPKGPRGPVDFDELLSGAAANTRAPMGEGPLFTVFASLSMPQASLSAADPRHDKGRGRGRVSGISARQHPRPLSKV